MSRIGKVPIVLPPTTKIERNGKTLVIEDKKGRMQFTLPEGIIVEQKDNALHVIPQDESRKIRTLWGTTRASLANIVKGVSEGFHITLHIEGVGYRAQIKGKDIVLQLGYSHEVVYPVPQNINVSCPQPTQIVLSGHDRQQLGQMAAEIRSYRVPEPYKGKGIRRANETILRKEGKKKK